MTPRQPRALPFAFLLAVVFLAGHLPFLASTPDDIDSVNFSLAVRDFDVAAHQPHPPGYPLFVGLGRVSDTGLRLLGLAGGERAARGLALSSALLGALAALPLLAFFFALERDTTRAAAATALTLACPLFWISAARPMSDVPGLAVALVAQACFAAVVVGGHDDVRSRDPRWTRNAFVLGALVAGLALGVRSQSAWLTTPIAALATLAMARRGARRELLAGGVAFAGGIALWLVPLFVASGGVGSYLAALASQAGEDAGDVQMLATHRTVRHAGLALVHTFLLPWGSPALALAALALAGLGGLALVKSNRRAAILLAWVSLPYLGFHLLFQETATTRYALPLVPPIAYLAIRGLAGVSRRVVGVGASMLVAASLATATPALAAYARSGSPLWRALHDVRARERTHPQPRPALAMQHAVAVALRGESLPLPSLPVVRVRQWLSIADYWRGADGPLWFLAEPDGTGLDRHHTLAAVDPASRRLVGAYRWGFDVPWFLGGVRPSNVDWWEISDPGWIALEGWALTPDLAGVSHRGGRGPGRGGSGALVRRRAGPAVLMLGGRNLGRSGDPTVRFELTVDGAPLDAWVVPPSPGFFLRFLDLPAGALAGPGRFAELLVVARAADGSGRPAEAAVEQFDVQPPGRVMLGFGRGWHEAEYDAAEGRQWRWSSDRAELHLRDVGTDQALEFTFESPLRHFDSAPTVSLSVNGCILREGALTGDDRWRVVVPAKAIRAAGGIVTLSTTRVFAPAERLDNDDQRRLGLRVFAVNAVPAAALR